MRWTDDIQIETPEQIDVSLELAGLGSRFVARLLDWLVEIGTLVVIGILGLVLLSLLGVAMGRNLGSIFVTTFLVGLALIFFLGYDVYFEVRQNGQTPGKKRAGIRVIREGGAPVDFRSSCIRNLLSAADFLPAFHFLGGLLVLLSARNQRLGDMAAGTIVIRERVLDAPGDLSKQVDPLASEEFAFTAEQLRACFPDGRHILRSFFQRYPEMDADARGQLARRLAEEFVRKTSYPLPAPLGDGVQAETFLACLYRDLEKLTRTGR